MFLGGFIVLVLIFWFKFVLRMVYGFVIVVVLVWGRFVRIGAIARLGRSIPRWTLFEDNLVLMTAFRFLEASPILVCSVVLDSQRVVSLSFSVGAKQRRFLGSAKISCTVFTRFNVVGQNVSSFQPFSHSTITERFNPPNSSSSSSSISGTSSASIRNVRLRRRRRLRWRQVSFHHFFATRLIDPLQRGTSP